MIKNPQIKFQGYLPKQYLFPKYPGKFFIQAEKLRDLKVLRNYMPQKVRKEIKIYNDVYRDEYKEMKAETDYVRRIQELKKKLEKEIKRYNNEKKSNQQLVRNLSLSIDHKSSMIKLKEICVNMRTDRKENSDHQNSQAKSLQRKRSPKNVQPGSYQLKNKTEIKQRSMTQQSDNINLRHLAYMIDARQHYSNQTERLCSSEVIKLPKIARGEDAVYRNSYQREKDHASVQNRSENQLSQLSSIDKLTLAVNFTPTKFKTEQTQLINDTSTQQVEKTQRRRFMYSLSEKYSAKRNKKRLLESDHKSQENQLLLKGWEIGPQSKGFNDNDYIY